MNTLPVRGSNGVPANVAVGSPGCRSRHSSTRSTATSSTAQPVTPIDPCSPVAPAAGVSITPVGAVDAPGRFSRAPTVDVAAVDPVYVTVIAPITLALPAGGTADAYCTPIDSAAGPDPDAGLTVNHGAFDAAVHVTGLGAPVWAMYTVWAGVWNRNPAPEFTAPKFSDALSTPMVGRSITVNVTPLLATQPTVTVTVPVVAPLGTVVATLVADHAEIGRA